MSFRGLGGGLPKSTWDVGKNRQVWPPPASTGQKALEGSDDARPGLRACHVTERSIPIPTLKLTKPETGALFANLAKGAEQHLSNDPVVTFAGRSLPLAELLGRLHAYADLQTRVEQRRAAYETALEEQNAKQAESHELMVSFVDFVRSVFGNKADVLNDFGLAPLGARKTPTVEEKLAAVVKREATRQARHTMGPKARLAIHGNVEGVTVTPVVEPAPEAPAPGKEVTAKP